MIVISSVEWFGGAGKGGGGNTYFGSFLDGFLDGWMDDKKLNIVAKIAFFYKKKV